MGLNTKIKEEYKLCTNKKRSLHNCTVGNLRDYVNEKKISIENIETRTEKQVFCAYGKNFFKPFKDNTIYQLDDYPVTFIFNTSEIINNAKEMRPFDSGFYMKIEELKIKNNWENDWTNKKVGKFIAKSDLSENFFCHIINEIFKNHENYKKSTLGNKKRYNPYLLNELHDFYKYIVTIKLSERIEKKRLLTLELVFEEIKLFRSNIYDVVINAREFVYKNEDSDLNIFIEYYSQHNTEFKTYKSVEELMTGTNDIWDTHLEHINRNCLTCI